MSKCCAECVFYSPPTDGWSCGECDYPVPEWLVTGVSSGSFIGSPKYSGDKCPVFKSKIDVASEEKVHLEKKNDPKE